MFATTTPSWVFDANVIVSAHLNPAGIPAALLNAVITARLKMTYDPRIALEYISVLNRKKFGFKTKVLIDFTELLLIQNRIYVPTWLKQQYANLDLPDESDRPFIEVAYFATNQTLVTGNLKHYPLAIRKKINPLSPAEAYHKI